MCGIAGFALNQALASAEEEEARAPLLDHRLFELMRSMPLKIYRIRQQHVTGKQRTH